MKNDPTSETIKRSCNRTKAAHLVSEESRRNATNKSEFSHLFQSIFYRSLVPRMNDFQLNYAVLIKIDRIWNQSRETDEKRTRFVYDFFLSVVI